MTKLLARQKRPIGNTHFSKNLTGAGLEIPHLLPRPFHPLVSEKRSGIEIKIVEWYGKALDVVITLKAC